jgi:hypothetical protein
MRLGPLARDLARLLSDLDTVKKDGWTYRDVLAHCVSEEGILDDPQARQIFADQTNRSDRSRVEGSSSESNVNSSSEEIAEPIPTWALDLIEKHLPNLVPLWLRERLSKFFWRSICSETEKETGMTPDLARLFYTVLLPAATLLGLWILLREFAKRPHAGIDPPASSGSKPIAPQNVPAPLKRSWTLEVAVRGTQLPPHSIEAGGELSTAELIALAKAASYRQCVPQRPPLPVEGTATFDRHSERLVLLTIEFRSSRWSEAVLINEWHRYLQEEYIRGTIVRVATIDSPVALSRAGFYET